LIALFVLHLIAFPRLLLAQEPFARKMDDLNWMEFR